MFEVLKKSVGLEGVKAMRVGVRQNKVAALVIVMGMLPKKWQGEDLPGPAVGVAGAARLVAMGQRG